MTIPLKKLPPKNIPPKKFIWQLLAYNHAITGRAAACRWVLFVLDDPNLTASASPAITTISNRVETRPTATTTATGRSAIATVASLCCRAICRTATTTRAGRG
jgi:hypothetical protein